MVARDFAIDRRYVILEQVWDVNWFQQIENSMDAVHLSFAHAWGKKGRFVEAITSAIPDLAYSETAAGIRKLGRKALLVKGNIASLADVKAMTDKAFAEVGHVDVLVNNAGLARDMPRVPIEDLPLSEWNKIIGTNLTGMFIVSKAVVPYLKQAGDGHIVNTSSLFGLLALPTQGTYNASKFAVRGFTESLRQELDLDACGVSATCVHPGGIRTNIAMAARIDPAMQKRTGSDPEQARKRFDKLLNTTTAESAALQILRAVEKNKRRVLVGPDAKLLDKVVRLLGSWYQLLIMRQMRHMAGPGQH